jgi:alpha-ketoglutarate-dependent taurine dioxygenase
MGRLEDLSSANWIRPLYRNTIISMTIQHKPWNNQIRSRLDDLRIDMTDRVQLSIKPVVESLQHYGFALLSGLGANAERNVTADELLDLAVNLGTVVPQSPRGEAVEDVRDFSDVDVKDDRGYRSRGELSPHSDPPSLIVLHCLNQAKSGGESYLVNVRSIHDRIQELAPELLAILYQGYPFWCVEGQHGSQQAGPAAYRRAIFARRNDTVSCVHYRPFIEKAAQALDEPLSRQQIAALDLFDKYSSSQDLALRFHLQSGQTMVLHNRTVLHARTDYEDWSESDRRRHLLRVWIDAPDLIPVATEHQMGNLFAV